LQAAGGRRRNAGFDGGVSEIQHDGVRSRWQARPRGTDQRKDARVGRRRKLYGATLPRACSAGCA